MKVVWAILITIWALGCIYFYAHHADKIDAMKKKDPDNPPILYDILGVGIILCWPLLVPKIISKSVKIYKERKKNR